MYFPCKDCVEGFNTRIELDKHITDKHIFICGECLKTFKTKKERVMHMRMDHKDASTKTTEQEKLLAEEYRRRESRKEKDRRATKAWQRCGQSTQPRRNDKRLRKGKGNLQPHRPEKKQNVLRETTKTRTKTTSPQKNQAARIQHMSQPKRSSGEPTRKATNKNVFQCIFPCRSKLTKTFLFILYILIRSLIALIDYFSAP